MEEVRSSESVFAELTSDIDDESIPGRTVPDRSVVAGEALEMPPYSAFSQPIGEWDTSSVAEVICMFRYNLAFNQPIDNWDTSSVTSMTTSLTRSSPYRARSPIVLLIIKCTASSRRLVTPGARGVRYQEVHTASSPRAATSIKIMRMTQTFCSSWIASHIEGRSSVHCKGMRIARVVSPLGNTFAPLTLKSQLFGVKYFDAPHMFANLGFEPRMFV